MGEEIYSIILPCKGEIIASKECKSRREAEESLALKKLPGWVLVKGYVRDNRDVCQTT